MLVTASQARDWPEVIASNLPCTLGQQGLCKRIISLAAGHTGEHPLKQSASHEPRQRERNPLFGIWMNVVKCSNEIAVARRYSRVSDLERLAWTRRPREPLSRQSQARCRNRRTWPYGFGHDSEDGTQWKRESISHSCQLRSDEHMNHTHNRY
jgi:hypothetical protein